jgi:hypothetical protein
MIGMKDRWWPGTASTTAEPPKMEDRVVHAGNPVRPLREPKTKPVVKDFSALADALKQK